MKVINRKNYNLIISKNEQINIEKHIKENKKDNDNLDKKKIFNNNNELNLNIEDISSTRDIFFENNNIFNNNISPKIDNLISPISPPILNENKVLSYNDTHREGEITNQQSIILSNLLQKNYINKNTKEEVKNKEENDNSLNFLIEDNNIASTGGKITNDDDIRHPGKKCGLGVYCSPDISYAESYAGTTVFNGEKYKCVLMLRLNPPKIRQSKTYPKEYILEPTTDEIRPYRILLKKC